ncbi:MAG: nuclear transport factor 2 family protein [Myxococcota bacterium]
MGSYDALCYHCAMNLEDEVLAANEAFYRAFAEHDADAMDALWARQHGVACIHPGWAALRSRAEIIDSWRSILDSPDAPPIRCADPTVTVAGAMGFVVCSELLPGGQLVATNIFVREINGWRICHHQAAPIARRIVVEPTPSGELN